MVRNSDGSVTAGRREPFLGLLAAWTRITVTAKGPKSGATCPWPSPLPVTCLHSRKRLIFRHCGSERLLITDTTSRIGSANATTDSSSAFHSGSSSGQPQLTFFSGSGGANYRHHDEGVSRPESSFRERTGRLGSSRTDSICGVCNRLWEQVPYANRLGMAFIVLRRSRNTRSYYLVESYRNEQGKTQRRTLCYLGREQDGTDTLAKAQAHWEQVRKQAQKELRRASGERRQVVRRRIHAARKRLAVIAAHLQLLAQAEAERRKREQQAEEAVHWQTFDRLRRQPTQENATAARRAFLVLAKRHHYASRLPARQRCLRPRACCLAKTCVVGNRGIAAA